MEGHDVVGVDHDGGRAVEVLQVAVGEGGVGGGVEAGRVRGGGGDGGGHRGRDRGVGPEAVGGGGGVQEGDGVEVVEHVQAVHSLK